MRILIATGIFKPDVGGPATIALELAKRLQQTGHKVSVLTYSDQAHHDSDNEHQFRLIRVLRTGNKLLNYIRYFFAAFSEINHHDVVYTLDWFSAGLPLMLAAKFRKKNYIARVGGGYIWEKYIGEGRPPMTLKEFYARGLYREYRVMFYIIKKVLSRAAIVVFNSEFQRELYCDVYGLQREKTTVIQNAVPENRISSLVQNYNAKNFSRDKEIIVASRLTKVKNIPTLLKAFVKIPDQAFRLVLIGEGPEKDALKAEVVSMGIQERVEFLPSMTQSELYYRIAHCYLLVIASWTEVSPNQAYEALALGIPLLLTQENYLSIHNQFPLMFDPASVDDLSEKINLLLDPEKYKEFLEKLKTVSFKHTWQDVVAEHIRVFMKVTKLPA